MVRCGFLRLQADPDEYFTTATSLASFHNEKIQGMCVAFIAYSRADLNHIVRSKVNVSW